MAGRHALQPEFRKAKLLPIFVGISGALLSPAVALILLGESADPLVVTLAGVVGLWASFCLGYWMYRKSPSKALTQYPSSNNKLRFVILGFFGGVLLQLALAFLALLLIVSFELDPSSLSNVNSLPITDEVYYESGIDLAVFAAIAVLAIVVLAPVTEELFFRGAVLPILANRFGPIAGVLLSSLAFGMMHIQPTLDSSLYVIFMTACAGVVLAIARLKSQSLLLPIFMHMGFNSWAVLILVTLYW